MVEVWGDCGILLSIRRGTVSRTNRLSVSYPDRLKAVSVDMLLKTEAVIGTEGIEKKTWEKI